MIKIIAKEASVYFPIGQIKTLYFDRETKKVKVFFVDNMETEYENVLKVYYNNEEI